MDIYDRSGWLPPDQNPLVRLLQSGEEWFSNEQLVKALGLSATRGLVSNQTTFVRQLRDDDTAIESRGSLFLTKEIRKAHGGTMRVFNRRGLILAAMRVNTTNAAAFRDWLASRVAEEVAHG